MKSVPKEYSKIIKGKLSFKGENRSNSKSAGKRKLPSRESEVDPHQAEEPEFVAEEKQGIGRITSSGTSVHGHFTDFMQQLTPGDAIIVTHPTR